MASPRGRMDGHLKTLEDQAHNLFKGTEHMVLREAMECCAKTTEQVKDVLIRILGELTAHGDWLLGCEEAAEQPPKDKKPERPGQLGVLMDDLEELLILTRRIEHQSNRLCAPGPVKTHP